MRVTFMESASGITYFERFISKLNYEDKSIILDVFRDICDFGLNAKGCDFRQIEGKLWEIKINVPSGGFRFFYIMLNKEHLHVVHFYKKQGQKAPKNELELARKRIRGML